MKRQKILISVLLALCIPAAATASTFFSGYAGGKLNLSSDSATYFGPDLKLQAFFAGQFNFSQNIWSHLEFSIDTENLIDDSFFLQETAAKFQIDELSLIYRYYQRSSATYVSAFMGYYDPIGSDVFLQRYFGMPSISSMLTESWLGLAGSVLYPHFGIGVSDVMVFFDQPIAVGAYAYMNHENHFPNVDADTKFYVLNGDLRLGCSYRFFTMDLALGAGIPINTEYGEDDSIYAAVDTVYWHAGTTMLIGNNYTNSLFIQGGLGNAPFRKNETRGADYWKDLVEDNVYLFAELRFREKNTHTNITVFSLPPKTVEDLLSIDDTLGVNLNVHSDSLALGNRSLMLGIHVTLSFPDRNFLDIFSFDNLLTDFKTSAFNINVTPYGSANFLSGELHTQLTVRGMSFGREELWKSFLLDIGYRTTF